MSTHDKINNNVNAIENYYKDPLHQNLSIDESGFLHVQKNTPEATTKEVKILYAHKKLAGGELVISCTGDDQQIAQIEKAATLAIACSSKLTDIAPKLGRPHTPTTAQEPIDGEPVMIGDQDLEGFDSTVMRPTPKKFTPINSMKAGFEELGEGIKKVANRVRETVVGAFRRYSSSGSLTPSINERSTTPTTPTSPEEAFFDSGVSNASRVFDEDIEPMDFIKFVGLVQDLNRELTKLNLANKTLQKHEKYPDSATQLSSLEQLLKTFDGEIPEDLREASALINDINYGFRNIQQAISEEQNLINQAQTNQSSALDNINTLKEQLLQPEAAAAAACAAFSDETRDKIRSTDYKTTLKAANKATQKRIKRPEDPNASRLNSTLALFQHKLQAVIMFVSSKLGRLQAELDSSIAKAKVKPEKLVFLWNEEQLIARANSVLKRAKPVYISTGDGKGIYCEETSLEQVNNFLAYLREPSSHSQAEKAALLAKIQNLSVPEAKK